MRCNICNTDMSFIFNKNILNKYNVRYFYCPKCGYLTTEEPFWLKEAYSNAIAITDIGLRGCPACFLILKDVVISSHETNRFS